MWATDTSGSKQLVASSAKCGGEEGKREGSDKVQRMMSPVKMNPQLASYRLGDTK